MSASLYTEFNVVKPLQFEHKMKYNDLVSLLNQQNGRVESNLVEIFPDEKVHFVLRREGYNSSFRLWMEKIGGPGDRTHSSFAGIVEVDIDGVSQIGTFGNVEKNEYVPLSNSNYLTYYCPHPYLGPFKYYVDGDKKITMEVKWTIYQQQPISVVQQGEKIPESLMNQESRSVVGAAMMDDFSTADLVIKCGAVTFRVHKVVLCSRSAVFRAMMQGDMVEARKGKVTVTDVDSGTFAAVLHYVYTGDLKEGQDLNNMIYAAEKYDLPGLKGLMFFRMKSEDIQEELIPDLLIIADKYQAGPLRKLALEKIRANRKIVEEREFQRKLANFQHILFDLLQQL